jgi:pimeloyl-ACP methyl ester carboxylesterase
METVVSQDGTSIAFERFGLGHPLILVVGAFNTRSTGEPLAQALASHFTVYSYDRRGRGDSDDTPPYAIEREVEDLAALIGEAGGAAAVFGYSSGALLALHAASRSVPITRLVLYDAPYGMNASQLADHPRHLEDLVSAGRRGDAVEYFQSKIVGIPDDVVVQLRHAPFRPELEAIAHTLVYEATVLADPSLNVHLAAITTPTLVIAGGANPFMIEAAKALAAALPSGQAHVLEGQSHDIDPSVLSPAVKRFLA